VSDRAASPWYDVPPRLTSPAASARSDRPSARVTIKTDGPVTLSDLYCAILSLQQQVANVAAIQREMRGELAALRNRPNSSF
jgi:hypothetical protein